jgi:eukaryotic-like serine/threonine-protein kinase
VKSPRNTAFERHALVSGLLSQEHLDEARETLRPFSRGDDLTGAPPSGKRLADQLVDLGHLNPWQASQLLEGRTKFSLGPYRIVDSLGRGGMGQVFKAEHSILNDVVAIKVLPRDRCTPEAIADFAREVRAQSQLDHPNLVRALDAGEDGNVHYLVTEYVPGSDLRKLIRRGGRMDTKTAAHVIFQVAAALEHAHQRGLIHRDVKPGNVLVAPDGTTKLSDLGLAGPLGGDAQDDPRIGKIAGTADYLSPDHITAPWNPTPAWDIYSLGCTLYYAVTGNVPFPKGTIREKVNAHCTLRPLDPRQINSRLEPELVEVMADMMAKDPAERIGSAGEVIQRLSRWTGESCPPLSPEIASTSKSDSPVGPEDILQAKLEDTQPSFPEIPLAGPDQTADSSQLMQATLDVATAREETSTEPQPLLSDPLTPTRILRPLAVLLGLPVAIACAISLIWWLVRLAH